MKYQNRIMALPMLCMIIIVLSACCFDEQKNETSNVNPKVQSVETVSVTRGNLTPTVSAHTTIIPACIIRRVIARNKSSKTGTCIST